MVRMKRKFLRRDWNKMIRLGGRRKKLKWRRATGAHNKIRQKWKGYSQQPSVGYKTPREIRGLVDNKTPVMINNISDLMKLKGIEIGIVSKTVGQKKKIDIAKKAVELKAVFANFDAHQFLEDVKKAQEAKKKTEPKAQDKTVQVQSEKKTETKTEEKKA